MKNKDILCLNLDTDKYENIIHYDIDMDTTIFLHIDFEEVLRRAYIRDVPKYGEEFLQKYINKYIPIQKRYLEEYEPERRSDIIINKQDYHNPRLLV